MVNAAVCVRPTVTEFVKYPDTDSGISLRALLLSCALPGLTTAAAFRASPVQNFRIYYNYSCLMQRYGSGSPGQSL
jgi:hypothetical protein